MSRLAPKSSTRRPRLALCGWLSVLIHAGWLGFAGDRLACQPVLPTHQSVAGESHLLKSAGLVPESWTQQGIDVEGFLTLDYRRVWQGNLGSLDTVEGLAEAGVSLDGTRMGLWSGLTAHLWALYPFGRSLSNRQIGDFGPVSDIDAYDSVRLYELWFQHETAEGGFRIRAGMLSPEQDFVRSELADSLQNGAFGWPPFTAMNVPSTGYPFTAPGVLVGVQPTTNLWMNAAVLDGNPEPYDAAGKPVNPHSYRVRFDEGVFGLWEVGLRHRVWLPGVVRGGLWFHTGRFAASDPSGRAMYSGNGGLYLLADQTLWAMEEGPEEGPKVEGFARMGWAPEDRNLVDLYAEAGLRGVGWVPGRSEDALAVGVAWTRTGAGVRRQAAALGTAEPGEELVLEVLYDAVVRPWFHLQPDLQWVRHPGGQTDVPDAWVVGLRTAIRF
jgi:porin